MHSIAATGADTARSIWRTPPDITGVNLHIAVIIKSVTAIVVKGRCRESNIRRTPLDENTIAMIGDDLATVDGDLAIIDMDCGG